MALPGLVSARVGSVGSILKPDMKEASWWKPPFVASFGATAMPVEVWGEG